MGVVDRSSLKHRLIKCQLGWACGIGLWCKNSSRQPMILIFLGDKLIFLKKLKRYLDTRPYSVMNYQSRLNLVPNSDRF